jgi:hypothetical protein
MFSTVEEEELEESELAGDPGAGAGERGEVAAVEAAEALE